MALVYIVCEVFFLPGTVLCVLAGYTFNKAYNDTARALLVATPTLLTAALVAAIFAFVLGRYVLRFNAKQLGKKYPIVRALNLTVESDGIMLAYLLRLCPIVPL